MLPCHSCCINWNWRSKELGGLKPSYGEKGVILMGEIAPSTSLSPLPTYFRLFWHKKSSMMCTT